MLIGACLGLALGIVYLHVATKYYTATIIVGPTSAVPAQAGLGNLSGLSLSSLGGLGSKISSFVGGSSDSAVAPFDAFQQTLTSRELAYRLLAQPELVRRIFYQVWNEKERRWQEPTSITHAVTALLKSVLGMPSWHPPDVDTVEQYLEDKIAKTPLPGSSMISLSFEFENPVTARDFLNAVYEQSDLIVRNMDLERSNKVIQSINEELSASAPPSASAREYLIQFLDQEYQVKALARADVAYAASVFDPISVSLRPTRPTVAPAILFGILLGGIGGMICSHLNLARRSSGKSPHAKGSVAKST